MNTGFPDLDDYLGDLRPGTLTVVAAERGRDIEAFLLDVVAHVAAHQRHPVAILTTVAPRSEVAEAFAAQVAPGARPSLLMRAEQRLLQANRAEAALHLLPVTVAETQGSLEALSAQARKLHTLRPYDLALVLGPPEALSSAHCSASLSRTRASVRLIAGLRSLACELGIPVWVQADLSPAVGARIDRSPLLSDLPAHGLISRHCDATLFLCGPQASQMRLSREPLHQVIVAHNRSRPLGSAVLRRATGELVAWG